MPYGTLQRYSWVAKSFDNLQRRRNLSFTHHEAVAARDDRLKWLEGRGKEMAGGKGCTIRPFLVGLKGR